MRELKEATKVVVTKSIAEQIVDAPVESVVIVRYSSYGDGLPRHTDALVKTGIDGYQRARDTSRYLHHEDIADWVKSYGEGAKFFIEDMLDA